MENLSVYSKGSTSEEERHLNYKHNHLVDNVIKN